MRRLNARKMFMILESLLFFMWNSSLSIQSQHVHESYRITLLLLLLISFQTSFWLTMIHFTCVSYDFDSVSTTSRFCSSMKVITVASISFLSVSIFFRSWNSKRSFKRSLFFSEWWFTYSLMSRYDTDVNVFANSLCQFNIKIEDSRIRINLRFDFSVAVKLLFIQRQIIDHDSSDEHFASRFWGNFWDSMNRCLSLSFSWKRLTFAWARWSQRFITINSMTWMICKWRKVSMLFCL